MRSLLTAALTACVAAPAAAEPEWQGVYEGVIGASRIIASLTPEGARYVYVTRPNDLGLQITEGGDGLTLTETLAPNLSSEDLRERPGLVSGKWRVTLQGEKLNGRWTDARGGRPRKISLTRVSRQTEGTDQPLDPNHLSPYGARWLAAGPDFAPMGSEARIGDLAYTMVRDSLFGNVLPRLTHAPDGVRIDAVNNLLEKLHKTLVLRDRNCLQDLRTATALQEPRRLASLDKAKKRAAASQESIEPVFGSSNLFALVETRSRFCGGAYPANMISAFTFDLRTTRQIGGLAEQEDNFSPSGVGAALDIAGKANRERFDAFWTGRLRAQIDALAQKTDADETGRICGADLLRQIQDSAGRLEKIVYPKKEGLAVHATGYAHALSVCMHDYAGGVLLIPWRELKPFYKSGQKLLPEPG